MTTQQTEALQCAADLEYSIARHGMQDAFTLNAYRAMKMVRTQQARITDLEAQLEAIGAGGVSGPLIGQPQAMPDLSQLTERGAKAWAGVDAQGLREGGADMSKERDDLTAFYAWLHTYESEVGALDDGSARVGFIAGRASLQPPGFTAADMATAAQQGVVYAELPVANYPKSGGFPGTFAEAQMRAFADATHTLRASHGQAPAKTGNSVSAQADSVQEDAARYRFLRDGEWRGTDLEPFIRLQLNTLWDAKIDDARKQGANHDR